MSVYEKLRALGLSAETADALAPVIEKLPEPKRSAFYFWASGMTQRQACKEAGISKGQFWRILEKLRAFYR